MTLHGNITYSFVCPLQHILQHSMANTFKIEETMIFHLALHKAEQLDFLAIVKGMCAL